METRPTFQELINILEPKTESQDVEIGELSTPGYEMLQRQLNNKVENIDLPNVYEGRSAVVD